MESDIFRTDPKFASLRLREIKRNLFKKPLISRNSFVLLNLVNSRIPNTSNGYRHLQLTEGMYTHVINRRNADLLSRNNRQWPTRIGF